MRLSADHVHTDSITYFRMLVISEAISWEKA